MYYFRTLKAFEQWLRKGGKGTDYVIYSEICVMMNVIIDCKSRVSTIDEIQMHGNSLTSSQAN